MARLLELPSGLLHAKNDRSTGIFVYAVCEMYPGRSIPVDANVTEFSPTRGYITCVVCVAGLLRMS